MFKNILPHFFTSIKTSFFASFLSIFGFAWLIIESTSFFMEKVEGIVKENGFLIFLIVTITSIIVSIILNLPKKQITKKFNSSNTEISIKVGNLLNEKGNIAIGISNYLDTIKRGQSKSLKRQIIDNMFNGQSDTLNNQIQESINSQGLQGEFDPNKTYGNQHKFPVGTVATALERNRKIFFVVLSELTFDSNNNKITNSDIHKFNKALYSLWNMIDIQGNQEEISIPVLGSGLSRLSFHPLILIQTIILSYAHVAANKRITKKLNIIVRDKNYDASLFEELNLFMDSIKI